MAKLQNYIWDKKCKPFCGLFRSLANLSRVFALATLSLSLLQACHKKSPSPPETIAALQQLQELATVEYTVSKVVKADDNQTWYKWGDRKILFTCEATIKAGIDLSKLTEEDIRIEGSKIRIVLPEPSILLVNLPPDKIRVAFSEIGVFRSEFSTQEKDALMTQAEKQIWAAAPQTGILQQAKLNTQTFLTQWLHQMGFEQVELSFDNAVYKVRQKQG